MPSSDQKFSDIAPVITINDDDLILLSQPDVSADNFVKMTVAQLKEKIGGGGGAPSGMDYLNDLDSAPSCANVLRDFLTADGINPNGAWAHIRGSETKTAGKLYFELNILYKNGNDHAHGVTAPGSNLVTYPGQTSGFGMGNDGTMFSSWGGAVTNGAAFGTGDVVGIALDFTAGAVTYYKNNVAGGGVTGMTIPSGGGNIALGFRSAGNARCRIGTVTPNLVYAPPAGFTPWA